MRFPFGRHGGRSFHGGRAAGGKAMKLGRFRSAGQWFGLLVSAVLLFLIVRKAQDLPAAGQAIRDADGRWLLAGALLYLLTFLPRGLRWGRLLAGVRTIPLLHLTEVEAIGFMANNVLPFRLGEIVRAYTIGRKAKLPVTTAFATIVMERLCDGLALVLTLAVISLFYPFPAWVKRAGILAALLFLGATVFLVLLAYRRDTARSIVTVCTRPLPAPLTGKIIALLDQFDRGLHLLRSPFDAVAVAALSALIWVIEFGVYLCVLASFAGPIQQAIGRQIPLHDALLLMILVNFGSIIPSGPAYVGTFQAVAIAVLTGVSHVGEPVAFSYSWVLWATMVVPIVAVGFACLAAEQVSLGSLFTARGDEEMRRGGISPRGGRAPSVDRKPNRHDRPGGSG
jgi:glycosyltransferase 2 family protein